VCSLIFKGMHCLADVGRFKENSLLAFSTTALDCVGDASVMNSRGKLAVPSHAGMWKACTNTDM